MRVGLFIPTLNPGRCAAEQLVTAIQSQTLRPDDFLVADSESTDDSTAIFSAGGARILTIRRSEFDHGGTRNLAFQHISADVYIFLTQDATPRDAGTFERLVQSLKENPRAGVAYGRQVAQRGAGPLEVHGRLFNYPPESGVRSRDDIPRLGIRAAFCSNAFAAYRRAAMADIGWFPERLVFGEDTAAAARLLLSGWQASYAADAVVTHSHNYTLRQEFSRYFDAGAFHARQAWYRTLLRGPSHEGWRFVRSEFQFAWRAGPMEAAQVPIRNATRWLGYQSGRHHHLLPRSLRRKLGLNKSYWNRDQQTSASQS